MSESVQMRQITETLGGPSLEENALAKVRPDAANFPQSCKATGEKETTPWLNVPSTRQLERQQHVDHLECALNVQLFIPA